MIDYRVIQILHPHGSERVEMHRQPHDAADIDPERKWGKGAIVFKCSRCEEEIVVLPPAESPPGLDRAAPRDSPGGRPRHLSR